MIIRTKRHGCFQFSESPAWGAYLVPVDDPEGQDVPEDDLRGIKLIENFPRLPAELWGPFISLAFHFCPEKKKKNQKVKELEVSIVLLRKADDLSQWKIVVPEQVVTGASVEAKFDNNCDIVTGEIYNQFPPPGYIHAGSAHSHNTMGAFFSGTDDANELGVPGMHIVVGKINKKKGTYQPNASICLKKCRKYINIDHVVDTTPVRAKFHPNVLSMIKEKEIKKEEKGSRIFGPSLRNSILENLKEEIREEIVGNSNLDSNLENLFDLNDDDEFLPRNEEEEVLIQEWWEKIEAGGDLEIDEPSDEDLDALSGLGGSGRDEV